MTPSRTARPTRRGAAPRGGADGYCSWLLEQADGDDGGDDDGGDDGGDDDAWLTGEVEDSMTAMDTCLAGAGIDGEWGDYWGVTTGETTRTCEPTAIESDDNYDICAGLETLANCAIAMGTVMYASCKDETVEFINLYLTNQPSSMCTDTLCVESDDGGDDAPAPTVPATPAPTPTPTANVEFATQMTMPNGCGDYTTAAQAALEDAYIAAAGAPDDGTTTFSAHVCSADSRRRRALLSVAVTAETTMTVMVQQAEVGSADTAADYAEAVVIAMAADGYLDSISAAVSTAANVTVAVTGVDAVIAPTAAPTAMPTADFVLSSAVSTVAARASALAAVGASVLLGLA